MFKILYTYILYTFDYLDVELLTDRDYVGEFNLLVLYRYVRKATCLHFRKIQ